MGNNQCGCGTKQEAYDIRNKGKYSSGKKPKKKQGAGRFNSTFDESRETRPDEKEDDMFFETQPMRDETNGGSMSISNNDEEKVSLRKKSANKEEDEDMNINKNIIPMGFNSEIDHKLSMIYNHQRDLNFIKIYQ